jgi:hypothetical protein
MMALTITIDRIKKLYFFKAILSSMRETHWDGKHLIIMSAVCLKSMPVKTTNSCITIFSKQAILIIAGNQM